MPTYRTGRVVRLLAQRDGLQRVEVDLGGDAPERAYVLTQLTGEVAVDHRVVVNTTAVELGLGTGGWHVVHWDLDRESLHAPGPGHIMKLRYTSLQVDAGSAEEHLGEAQRELTSIDGLPVVHVPLHSQLAAAVAAIRDAAPDARIAYVMTDGAALPLALSDLVATLRERRLIDVTVTAGHAFGGDLEAVSAHSALLVAREVGAADVAVVAMGPGIVGTGTRLGHTGVEAATWLTAAAALGGTPIAALRTSFADPRPRHRGLSHHTATALGLALREPVTVALPAVGGEEERTLCAALDEAGISERHDVVAVDPGDVLALLAAYDLQVGSMGRPAAEDPVLFAAAAAAGTLAVARRPGQ